MSNTIDRLIAIVKKLRGPNGCPWDREQTHKSILSCLLDESYEFFDAVDEGDGNKMCEELGDILLQIILHAQIAEDQHTFTIEDVAYEISEKLIRRHPHVFGDISVSSTAEVLHNWEQIKKHEKGKEHRKYLVDDIPVAMPALFRAEKIQRRVSRVGFDWQNDEPALDKVEEEFHEFRDALKQNDHFEAEEELGDIFFSLVNVARHNNICAENALRIANDKFIRRFRFIEDACKEANISIKDASLETLDSFWEKSKLFEN